MRSGARCLCSVCSGAEAGQSHPLLSALEPGAAATMAFLTPFLSPWKRHGNLRAERAECGSISSRRLSLHSSGSPISPCSFFPRIMWPKYRRCDITFYLSATFLPVSFFPSTLFVTLAEAHVVALDLNLLVNDSDFGFGPQNVDTASVFSSPQGSFPSPSSVV